MTEETTETILTEETPVHEHGGEALKPRTTEALLLAYYGPVGRAPWL